MYRFLLGPRWLGWLAVALALAAVMTMLGGWQLSRYEERSAINARIDAADPDEPAPLADLVTAPEPGAALGPPPATEAGWEMAAVTGRFDPGNEVLIRARTLSGRVGFEVLTPLVLADGSAVLINRGWLPPGDGGGTAAPEVPRTPAGEVTVVGRVRPGESGAQPVRRVDGMPQTRRIHLPSIAAELPYPVHGAYLQRAHPDDPALTPIPVRRENAWLNGGYAVQWWIFAGMVLVGFGWLARREARRLREPAAATGPVADNGGSTSPATGAQEVPR